MDLIIFIVLKRSPSFGISNRSALINFTNCLMTLKANTKDTVDRLSNITQTKTTKINRRKTI